MADHMLTEPVTDALTQAVAVRGVHVGGTIAHSDRGQYNARAMMEACADAGRHDAAVLAGGADDGAQATGQPLAAGT